MDKYEFIRQLNAFLKGKVSDRELSDTISYYQDYIDMEMKKGKSEAEVLQSLGSPRLLAKTIAQTRGKESGQETEQDPQDWNKAANKVHFGRVSVPLWLVMVIILLVVVLVFAMVFRVLVLLAPVIMVGAVVIFIYRLFTGKR